MPDAPSAPDAPTHAAGAPERAPRRGRRRTPRRGLQIGLGVALAAALAGGYVAACALAPLPDLEPRLSIDAEQTFRPDPEISAQRTVNRQSKPTALGWAGDSGAWTNDFDTPRQIASITKLVTVLVCLDAKPVEPGSDGPSYVLTERDAEIRRTVLESDGVVADVPVGRKLTTRQFIELALLPSSNNYAIGYAERVFGSNAGFQKAAAAWAEKHGLKTLRVSEPSGLSERNVASAVDLVEVGRLALADPLVAEVVAEPWADIPGIGPISNSNPLIGDANVIGLKTGTLSSAGFNLLAARKDRVGDREVVSIAAVLGRPDGSARARDARAVLRDAPKAADEVALVEADTKVGTVRTWQGETIELRATRAAAAVLLPDETASLRVRIGALGAGEAGRSVGVIRTKAPSGAATVPVVTARAIERPDLWWRVTHPATAFAGYFGG